MGTPDLVARLRSGYREAEKNWTRVGMISHLRFLCEEAADEIERLRAELEQERFDYLQCMKIIEQFLPPAPSRSNRP